MAGATTVTLRRMRWWDVAVCAQIEQALFADDPWAEPLFWSELAGVPESRHYVVATDDGAVVGYAGLMVGLDETDVQTVAVAPSHQRRGIGRLLLQELLTEAERRGSRSVMLEVAADNEGAIALYAAHGFVTIARRAQYYGSGRDSLVMRRG